MEANVGQIACTLITPSDYILPCTTDPLPDKEREIPRTPVTIEKTVSPDIYELERIYHIGYKTHVGIFMFVITVNSGIYSTI